MKANCIVIMVTIIVVGSDGDDNKVAEKSPGISSKKLQVAEGGEPSEGRSIQRSIRKTRRIRC